MKSSSIYKNTFFSMLYRIMNIIFPLISSTYIARMLGPLTVGNVTAIHNNNSYFIVLATLGISAYGLREIAKVREDRKKRSILFSELYIVNGIMTFVSVAIYTVFVMCFFEDNRVLYCIFYGSILFNFFNVEWLFYGMEEYSYIAIRNIAVKAVSLICLFLFVKSDGDVIPYVWITVLSSGINHLFNIFYARKIVDFRATKYCLTKHLKPLGLLALCSLSTEIYARLPITLLDNMSGIDDVAFYSYALKITSLLFTVVTSLTAVFLPRLSRLWIENRKQFDELVSFGLRIMILISIPLCCGLISLAKPFILLWLGEEYLPVVPCIRVLAVTIPIKCIGDLICYQVMIASGKERLLILSYALTLGVNIVASVCFLPLLGATGAAVAAVLAEIAAFCFVFIFARKQVKITISKNCILSTIISCSLMVIVVLVITHLRINNIVMLAIGTMSGIAVYLGMNILLRNEDLFVMARKVNGIIKRKKRK